MKKQIFLFGNFSYEYYLVRQARKTVSLIVEPSRQIILKCPEAYTDEKIQKFLEKKWLWLDKQLSYFKKYVSKNVAREYVSGESFLYLGRQYKLSVNKAKEEKVILKYGTLQIHTTSQLRDGKRNKELLDQWYASRVEKIFKEQYRKVLKNFACKREPELATRKMNKRWGSFLGGKKVVLNPKLIQAPKECIDYVITHELCHMTHKKHNQAFYKLLKSKINNWEKIKERLEMRFLER